jgi:hypothetical protein
MAQLSRPFQIGLLAVAVLAAAWLVLLRPHNTTATAPVQASAPTAAVRTVKASAAPTTAKPPKAKAKGNGSSSIYHGSAPGVQGLTRAIAKANGAVATSQQNAKQLEEKSTQASSATPTSTATTPSPNAAATTTTPTTSTPAAKAPGTSSGSSSGHGAASRGTSVARQHAVEAQLAKGRTAVILFWDPKGADDESVHSAVRSLRSQHSLNIYVQEASAGQVASFGSITRGLQVYGTPTLLIVGKKGQAKTLTGLQDAYAISQAIREVQHSS